MRHSTCSLMALVKKTGGERPDLPTTIIPYLYKDEIHKHMDMG